MRIVLGVLRPDAGVVHWRGRAVTREDVRRFGAMPEERGLYPKMTARRQVTLFGELSGMTTRDAAESAAALLDALGVGERADERVEALSLGNQQRVQLAVALVARPDLLVLDEPFSGLDPVGVDLLGQVLRDEAQRGAAVLFSSHQLDLVERLCDEVTIIDAGRVVVDGTIDELRRRRTGGRLLRVGLDGGWTAWADGLDAARVVAVVELLAGGDDQAVLDAARAAGRVRTFREEQPSLTDLFREVVER
jgi:ABC-2 type transport system ATP-binding protein